VEPRGPDLRIVSPMTRARNTTVSYILSFAFSALVALLVPIVPLIAFEMGASQLELGLVGSSSLLTYIPISMISGALSDRIGRKRLIIASSLVFIVSCLVYLASSSLTHLALGKMLEGISMSLLWPAVEALLADNASISGDRLVSNFGVLWSSGSVTGGIVSSFVLDMRQYWIVFLPCAGVALVLCAASILMISDFHRKVEPDSREGSSGASPSPLRMIDTWAVAMLYSFCQGTIFALYAPYAEIRGVSGMVIGLAIASILAGRTLIFFTYRHMRASFDSLATLGAATSSVSILLFAVSFDPPILLLSALMVGVGVGLTYIAAIGSALMADPLRRGKYAGLFEGSIGLGYLLGPATGGIVGGLMLEGPYVVSSLLAFCISAAFARRSTKRSR